MVEALVAWFEANQRSLPWRHAYDPYHVWLSEVMLQQTQVETVLPYYERFLREFPDIAALAQASEERVLKMWAGLGYYKRARNLQTAAREMVQNYGGEVPCDYDVLMSLPGIGQYIAGAVLSIAFNQRYPIVDGNVRRVLSRLHGWLEEDPRAQWAAAKSMVQSAEPRAINQALMELGATVRSFRNPRCLLCPVQSWCVAFKTGRQEEIPAVKKRPAAVQVHVCAIVHKQDGRYLMKPAEGLWEFPMFAELPAGEFEKVGSCRHTITHHRLSVTVYKGPLLRSGPYAWKEIEGVPISSLTQKVAALAEGVLSSEFQAGTGRRGHSPVSTNSG